MNTNDRKHRAWAMCGVAALVAVVATISALRINGKKPVIVKESDATNGHETLTLKGHTLAVFSVAFSPDGKRLASASADLTVKVWDATSGQETRTLKGHTGIASIVTSVAFSPDGKRLASASGDHTVKVWDVSPQ